MAKTLAQIQSMTTNKYDQREIINELLDYLQANPGGGGGAGVSGSFLSEDGKTIAVTNGSITQIELPPLAFEMTTNQTTPMAPGDFAIILTSWAEISGEIDFGDGTKEGFSFSGSKTFPHDYSSGEYDIKVYVNDALLITGINTTNGLRLSDIDVSLLVNLESLILADTGGFLTSIDVSNNLLLDTLYISGNPFTAIDISLNTALEYFVANACQLSAINISTNINLENIYCATNPLTALDISNNPALTVVWAQSCNLDVTNVSNILTTLDANGLNDGQCALEQNTPAVPNAGGQTAKTNLEGKGWTVNVDV